MSVGPLFTAAHLFALLLAGSALLLAEQAVAEDEGGRPWGRLEQPSATSASESQRQNGYLGRYNPWGSKEGGSTSDTPRYRAREDRAATSRARETAPYGQAQGFPSGQGYMPTYPPYQGQNSLSNGYTPYAPVPYTPYPGLFPGGGGLSPFYGNYWNDPYSTLQPDTGILWSDMWRR